MADLSDVLHGLRDGIAGVLYPNGVPAGPAPNSVANVPVRTYVGWPGADLDADLKAGIAHVTIWPREGMARIVGPYLRGWEDRPGPTASMTVAEVEGAVAFAGTGATPGMIAALIVDHTTAYTHQIADGQTPEQVAAALAALVAADRTATVDGATITIPDAFSVEARIVAAGSEEKELRRIEQSIQVSIWASRPSVRDALAKALDVAVEYELRTLPMPDGTKATINYQGTAYQDEARQQPLHRRDLFVTAEYSLRLVRPVPGIAVPTGTIAVDPTVIRRVVIS